MNSEVETKTLHDVKVGDRLLLRTGSFSYPTYSFVEVERVTPTTIIIKQSPQHAFKKEDGKRKGWSNGSWSPAPYLLLPEGNEFEQAKHRMVSDFKFTIDRRETSTINIVYDFLTQNGFL